ncbi:MAG: hypothetical protein SF069_15390 [Phycisphaerae bacterium]|nr:hypothetical protein [Phycisphaerae bacterium]
MRSLLGRSTFALATICAAGCVTQPPPDTLQSLRGSGPSEFPIACIDPETGELIGDCPRALLEETIVTLMLEEEQRRARDIDEDGIPNEIDPDVDGDGLPNESDHDIDDDGQPNGRDADADGDGKSGADDPDEDGDGLSDRFDLNDDGDGLFDDEDEDDDGDGDDEDEDDEEEDDDDDDDEEDESQPLDDLIERQRGGALSDEDRARIAKEITDRLDSPRVRDIVLRAIQDIGNRSDDLLRDTGDGAIPPQIAAIDAVYDQLSKALRQARRAADIKPGDPTPDAAVLQALGEFIPRAQALDELSKAFQLTSIRDLGLAVTDLRAGLGNADRVREFSQALARSAAADPISIDEGNELEKFTTGAALLGSTFDDASGGELLDSIRLIDGLVDSADELADALREVRDLGRAGADLDDAVNEVIDRLIGDIDDGAGGGNAAGNP